MRFAVIKSRFNTEIGEGLLRGALEYFQLKGIHQEQIDLFETPGAFEIPLLAKKLAMKKKYSGIVCLGVVIKGETAHFEWISFGAIYGIMQAMLLTEVPIALGVLTTYTVEQALARSQNNADNKGREAAYACYEMALLNHSLLERS
jgi:6,7-dimethyl-8-ribityllumazine synthase